MKANIIDLQAKQKGEIVLPKVFDTDYRPDVIRRAFLSTRSKKRQPYGTDKMAGKRTAAKYFGSRQLPNDRRMMNREMARIKRVYGDTAPGMFMRGRFVGQAVKGRTVHAPVAERKWEEKINKKERIFAIKSAIAATVSKELVMKRGHKVEKVNLPIIVDDSLQTIKKTKDIVEFLENVGLKAEIQKAKKKKVRSGKGTMRGRKYKRKKSVLFVVTENNGIVDAVKNITGTDICSANEINVEVLAPGSHAGRLTVFSESAIKRIGEIYG